MANDIPAQCPACKQVGWHAMDEAPERGENIYKLRCKYCEHKRLIRMDNPYYFKTIATVVR